MTRIILCLLGLCLTLPCLTTHTFARTRSHSPHPRVVETGTINLRDFGAIGDGVADDGPVFQKALDALAAAGGGTLFIPEGKYAIATPVIKDFTGLASSITIVKAVRSDRSTHIWIAQFIFGCANILAAGIV